MTAHDDVLDLEYVNRVLQYALAVEVGSNHLVGNVAMDKNLAGFGIDDNFRRHTTIGTANPKEIGGLLFG